MRCGTCGATVKLGLRVCPECGATLRQGRLRRVTVHCRACEARVPSDLRVCPYCGTRLQPSWRQPLVTLLVASLVIAGAYFLHSYVPWADLLALPSRVRLPSVAFLPTPSVAPSATATRTRTRTPAPSLTNTATTQPPTQIPTQPAATATSKPTSTRAAQPPLARPRLLTPNSQEEFRGGGAGIKLSWEPVGVLAENDWYALSVRFLADGVVQYNGTWTKETYWVLPGVLYTKAGQRERAFQWDVTVMRQTGNKPDGGRAGVALSATSETRTFFWY
jgi:RNA polymerase subunit RPABC4/transcription elongation factor Spt4